MQFSRRSFLEAAFGASMLVCGTDVFAAPVAEPAVETAPHQPYRGELPNIVFIFPDQVRVQAMGYMGEEPVHTPNLDALEKESLNLTEAVSNYPMCVPYRTIMMTGKYPLANGVLINCFRDGVQMPESHVWWPEILKKNGYCTAYLGKWHISLPDKTYEGKKIRGAWFSPKRRHGFDWMHCHYGPKHMTPYYCDSGWPCDRVHRPGRWSAEYEADCAIEYIVNADGKRRDPNKPFALVIGFDPPHTPYHLHPERYNRFYKDTDVEQLCAAAKNVPARDTKYGKYYRASVLEYYGSVTGIDDQVGRILRCLKAQGLEENTLFVFTSDHGDCQGRHDWVAKNNPFEESMRIPLLMRWPKKLKARRDPLLISVGDMYPTLISLLGLQKDLPEGLEGTDLSQTLLTSKGPRPKAQPYYCLEYGAKRSVATLDFGRRGIRTARYSLDITAMDQGLTEIHLYDRKQDPRQLHNLAEEQPALVRKLAEKHLRPWLEKTHDRWVKNLDLLK